MSVTIAIPELGDKFQDYRNPIPGDSYNWGPAIVATDIRYFAFHHSVTPQTAKNDGNWRAECDRIANEHLAQGWGGVGYRFIICSDGTVAYVGDLSHGGSAVAGNNNIMFSACLIGDFTRELPTAAQVHSAHILADFFLNRMPQYPNLDSWDDIIGHQDASALLHLSGATPTACPGSNWRDPNDSLRSRIINDRYAGYPNPQPTWDLPVVTPPPATQPPAPPTAPPTTQPPASTQPPAVPAGDVGSGTVPTPTTNPYKDAILSINTIVNHSSWLTYLAGRTRMREILRAVGLT